MSTKPVSDTVDEVGGSCSTCCQCISGGKHRPGKMYSTIDGMHELVIVCENRFANITPIDKKWECKVSDWFIQNIRHVRPHVQNEHINR